MTTTLQTLQRLTLSVLLAAGLAFASIAVMQPEAAHARAPECETIGDVTVCLGEIIIISRVP